MSSFSIINTVKLLIFKKFRIFDSLSVIKYVLASYGYSLSDCDANCVSMWLDSFENVSSLQELIIYILQMDSNIRKKDFYNDLLFF